MFYYMCKNLNFVLNLYFVLKFMKSIFIFSSLKNPIILFIIKIMEKEYKIIKKNNKTNLIIYIKR